LRENDSLVGTGELKKGGSIENEGHRLFLRGGKTAKGKIGDLSGEK